MESVTIPTLLNPHEAAAALHTSYGVLAVWRHHRRHPLRFVRIGRKIFYKPEDIQAFIEAQTDPGDGPRPTQRPARKQVTR